MRIQLVAFRVQCHGLYYNRTERSGVIRVCAEGSEVHNFGREKFFTCKTLTSELSASPELGHFTIYIHI